MRPNLKTRPAPLAAPLAPASEDAVTRPDPRSAPVPVRGELGTLVDLPVGASGVVARVDGEGNFRRRLLEMGLLPGTRLRLVRRVPLSLLIEIEVRGGLLSLREPEARTIAIGPDDLARAPR